ncbi:B-cell scaffold protein with ankyrin repeats [Gadus morhua]|uniref:B-cell scaffold protein with ankyrin repeats n=1 Tax=Gadus morhua TaxID=8049 RepID=UPI0011B5F9D1|nr:B-cell scaffold protein with ankyrin repeats-like [Gadus morhua]
MTQSQAVSGRSVPLSDPPTHAGLMHDSGPSSSRCLIYHCASVSGSVRALRSLACSREDTPPSREGTPPSREDTPPSPLLPSHWLQTQDLLILYEPEAAQWASYLHSVFTDQLPHDAIRLFDIATVTAGQLHDPLALARYRCKLLVLTPALVEQVQQDGGGGGRPCRVRRFFLCRVLTPAASVVVLLCGLEGLAPLLGLVPLQADRCLVVSTEQGPEEYLDAVVRVVWGEAGRRGSRGPAPDGQAGEGTNDAPSVVTTPPRPETGVTGSARDPGPPHGLRVVPLRVPCGVLYCMSLWIKECKCSVKVNVNVRSPGARELLPPPAPVRCPGGTECLSAQGSGEMFVLLRDKAAAAAAAAGGGDVELEFTHRHGHSVRVRPERWNQHVLLVQPPPDFPSGRVAVTLYCGACAVDTAHVTYYTPLDDIGQLLTQAADPVDFMCQALRVSSLEELDQKLSSLVTEGLPSGGLQQLGLLCDDTPLEGRGSSWCYCGPQPGALPTLLHLAAQYGLRALCGLLLQVPGAPQALATANRHGQTPGALARSHGHAELSRLLRGALIIHCLKGRGGSLSTPLNITWRMGSWIHVDADDLMPAVPFLPIMHQGEGRADDGVYGRMSAAVSAIPRDDEEDEEEEEDEEDPYTLVGTDDSEFDNTAPPGVVMPMAAPLAHRAPASTPRPDTTTSAAAGSSFIAQVFKNKTYKGNADLSNYPLEGQGHKASLGPPGYDAFVLGSEGLLGAPGSAAGGLDGPLGQLPGRVRRGSLTAERALEMTREWQRLHCTGLDLQQLERLNRLRANVISCRPDGDRENIYDTLNAVQPTKLASAGHKDSQPGEFYSQPHKGPHSNPVWRAEKR